jgi:hypothetical protein
MEADEVMEAAIKRGAIFAVAALLFAASAAAARGSHVTGEALWRRIVEA